MANDTTKTTDKLSIEYPADGYDSGSPTWGELYGQAFETIDSAVGDRLTEEEAQDAVNALLSGGDKVQLTYDDANDELTIDTSALDAEEVRDEVGTLLVGGNALTVTIDDAADSVTLAVDEGAISHDNLADVSEGDHRTTEQVEDIVDALLTAGDKVTLTYDDANDTLTVGTDALDAEEVRDEVGALLVGGNALTATIDDAGDTITLAVDESGISHDNLADVSEGDHRTTEQVEDIVDALLAAGDKVTTTYDDANDTLTIDTSALDAEEVRDEVGTLLSAGNGISIAVDDAGDTVTLSIPTDAVGVDELDESIAPTWTGEHEFSAGITGLPDPTDDSDAARKSYVDAIKQGPDAKDSVVATTTGNIDLTSSADPNPVDSVTLADGDRVLLKDQSTASENGIYVASTATDPTTWTRAPDADADDEVTSGLFTFVEEGSANANDGYVLATDGDISVGSTALSFVQFSGAGDITAGDGLTKSGDTLDVSVSDFAGIGLADSGSNDLDVDASAISHDNLADISEGDHRTTEQVQDIVGALVSGSGNISATYDDANDVLQIDTSALNTEEVQDAVSQLVSAGGNLSWNYDDANDTLTVSLSGPITGVQVGTDASRSPGYFSSVSTDALNTADFANATDGTVPTSQGDGTLAMESAGGADDSGNVLGGTASSSSDVAVGPTATSDSGGPFASVSVGENASVSGSAGVAIGTQSNAPADATSIGAYSDTVGNCVVLGRSGSAATNQYAVALGNSATADGEYSVALGYQAEASNDYQGVLGGVPDFNNKTSEWLVPGNFTVNGSKNFQIDNPSKPHTHDLRHGNYEGDVAGGLIYRRDVSITTDGETGTETIQMPDWFGPLATDVDVVVQAQGHFGNAYAEREEPNGEEITVTANADGDYNCIIFATRDDSNVPNPEDHRVVKPKGERWDGSPRNYYRDAPNVNPAKYDVERIEQYFEHSKNCDPTPCESAFVEWRVTLSDGERVDVSEPMDAAISTVVNATRDES